METQKLNGVSLVKHESICLFDTSGMADGPEGGGRKEAEGATGERVASAGRAPGVHEGAADAVEEAAAAELLLLSKPRLTAAWPRSVDEFSETLSDLPLICLLLSQPMGELPLLLFGKRTGLPCHPLSHTEASLQASLSAMQGNTAVSACNILDLPTLTWRKRGGGMCRTIWR